MDKQLKDFDQVVTPDLSDIFVCMQGLSTMKITTAQLFATLTNMSPAATLSGTEITICRQGSTNKKMTLLSLATYIISEA